MKVQQGLQRLLFFKQSMRMKYRNCKRLDNSVMKLVKGGDRIGNGLTKWNCGTRFTICHAFDPALDGCQAAPVCVNTGIPCAVYQCP